MKAGEHTPTMHPHAKSWPRLAIAAVAYTLLALSAAACSPAAAPVPSASSPAATGQPAVAGVRATAAPTTAPTAAPAPTAVPTAVPTVAPSVDLQKIGANKLGTILILEFHLIVEAEEDQFTITPDHFRKSLQTLYDAGYRPISLGDLLDSHIDLPAGTSPVVLTFDDSSPGQFTFVQQDGQLVPAANSAVGIMEAFHAAHPDFPLRGVFNVLPAADEPHRLFGQPEYETQKLRYLVDHGFELGNHTFWHQRLDEVDGQEVQRQIALFVKEIQKRVPEYKVRALALPQGMWPDNHALAVDGSFDGITYHNEAVLLVGSDPAPSPNSKGFDPEALERVQVFANNLDRWLSYLDKHPDEHYVSDGDPSTITFPKHLESQLNPASVGNKTVRTY